MFHLISKKTLHPWHLKKGHQDVWHGEACRLGRSCCCWSPSGVPAAKNGFVSAIFPPQKKGHVKFPFKESGPRNLCFFVVESNCGLGIQKSAVWGVFHCGHHDFWCGRRDQTGAVCNVTECFVGSQQYHLGGNFYHGMDGWDVLLTNLFVANFKGEDLVWSCSRLGI